MKNKTTNIISIISILLCIIPIVISIIFYNKIPEQIPSHFNFKGEVTSFGDKFSISILLPLVLTGANLLLIIITKNDPKLKNQSRVLRELVKFIIPIIIFILTSVSILASLNIPINITPILGIFLSILFILIGNYLPKCKQNYTIGIKLPWTLSDEENWTKTHRLAGFLYVIIGVASLILSLIFINIALFFVLISAVISSLILPIYSFILYKKSQKSRT